VPARETHSKLQRWTDLIAALLARRLGASFLELARDVPAYSQGASEEHKESVKRTFERDKDELRDFGIPIETLGADDNDETRYRLRATDFYLPFLALQDGERAPAAARAEGYRSLGLVTLTPDDLSFIGAAIARLEQLGDPALTADVRSAANKLAFDLPLFESVNSDVTLVDANVGADPKLFDLLGDALRNRKLVTFNYQKPSSDKVTERRVEPLGLFFINANWYLAARDRTRGEIRNFRLSRISKPVVNKKTPRTADYDVPPDFRLREHARSKDAWELGEAESVVAEVRFAGAGGATAAAARVGESVPGQADVRRFPVRRMDVFARWLLSFGGDARPVSPTELVEMYRKGVAETLSLYGSDA